MKALFIGGTGTISSAITALASSLGWELTLLNRGNSNGRLPEGVETIRADIHDEASAAQKLQGRRFDVVADFIAFEPEAVERDYRLFAGRTGQYIFISSASAYQKPPVNPFITESTPLHNPYWLYSRNKAACEDALMAHYRRDGFPITIVRPSHTYSDRSVPVGLHGAKGSWQVLRRMQLGKKVIIPGDGTTLWTLTHNEDFARGFLGLMGNPHAIGQSVHITSDERVTWNQAHQAVAAALGVELKAMHVSSEFLDACSPTDLLGPLLGDKSNNAIFDNSKIKELTPGFTAAIRFDQGARRCVDYMLSHPETQVEDPDFDLWCDRVIAALEEAKAKLRP